MEEWCAVVRLLAFTPELDRREAEHWASLTTPTDQARRSAAKPEPVPATTAERRKRKNDAAKLKRKLASAALPEAERRKRRALAEAGLRGAAARGRVGP